jgi:glycine hydroxymethyltransferase
MSGRYFNAVGYGLGPDGRIDYDQVAKRAHEFQPQLIICGATAHSRTIDYDRFRSIADEVGAVLLADISHVAGLVAAGLHPSPIDAAHVTTTCTHKQLYGPRGGIILSGRDADSRLSDGTTLRRRLQQSVFPFFQGAPLTNSVAAKASALAWCATDDFAKVARRIVADARALSDALVKLGYDVVSGGTDNHIVVLDLNRRGMSGLVAQQALERVGIVVNKNHVPGDRRNANVTSGLRMGTNTLAYRGAESRHIASCANLVDRTLSAIEPRGDTHWHMNSDVADELATEVRALAVSLPIGVGS